MSFEIENVIRRFLTKNLDIEIGVVTLENSELYLEVKLTLENNEITNDYLKLKDYLKVKD